jgi:hypothetical protein
MHADVHELFQVLSDDYFHRRRGSELCYDSQERTHGLRPKTASLLDSRSRIDVNCSDGQAFRNVTNRRGRPSYPGGS